jgi:hypothetical protein
MPQVQEGVCWRVQGKQTKLLQVWSIRPLHKELSTGCPRRIPTPRKQLPTKATCPARVYTLTPVEVDEEEERGDNDVVIGTIFLFSILACTLFDSRATHSFISKAYIKLHHVSTQP